ncbi:MAG TPA: HD domain-containing protein [Planctomycetota bacterium]|nr:HD domain-containing protein [Planctomycetota bacterium]
MKKADVAEALRYATEQHEGQLRKDGRTPYIEHPKAVMAIVRDEFGVDDPDVLAAALLHDTIEDTNADYDDIRDRFGKRVADWVAVLTKDNRLPDARREREYFRGLAKAPLQARLCKIADSTHNLRDSAKASMRTKAKQKARKLLSIYRNDRRLAKALSILRREVLSN